MFKLSVLIKDALAGLSMAFCKLWCFDSCFNGNVMVKVVPCSEHKEK
jgi:hypothetical protein